MPTPNFSSFYVAFYVFILFQVPMVYTTGSSDYIYDDDPISPTAATISISDSSTSRSLAIDVLSTIMSLLLSELKENISQAVTTPAADTTPVFISTTVRSLSPIIPVPTTNDTGNPSDSGDEITSAENSTKNIVNKSDGAADGNDENSSVAVIIENISDFPSIQSNSSSSTPAVNYTESESISFSDSTTPASSNVSSIFNWTDTGQSADAELSGGINITNNFTSDLVNASTERPMISTTSALPTVVSTDLANVTMANLMRSNYWTSGDDASMANSTAVWSTQPTMQTTASTQINRDNGTSRPDTTTPLPPIPTTTSTPQFGQQEQKSAGNSSICLHRPNNKLSPSDNKYVFSMLINSAQQWDGRIENVVCHFLAGALCHMISEIGNVSDCEQIKLEFIVPPVSEDTGIRVKMFAVGPAGTRLNPSNRTELMDMWQSQLTDLISSSFSNRTTSAGRLSTAVKSSGNALDNPVIATTLIAVVVTVAVTAFLSLLVLLLLQRRVRGRKGQWVVNKQQKKETKFRGAPQAYGWCFRNDAFVADEKKFGFAPPVPVPMLLDDRRRVVSLSVDPPTFDVTCTGAFPVPLVPPPVPPSLHSFNTFSTARGVPPAVPVRTTQVGKPVGHWIPNGRLEEMEMIETGRRRQQRW